MTVGIVGRLDRLRACLREPCRSTRTERLLVAGAAALGLGFAGVVMVLALQMRTDALARSRDSLTAYSVLVAEQADRAFQSLDLLHLAFNVDLQRRDITTPAQFQEAMSFRSVFNDLQERTQALPQFDAVLLLDANGQLVNTTRTWPPTRFDLSEREYIRALAANPALDSFVAAPARSATTGEWCFFVVRRFTAPDGTWLGVLVGVIELAYFQQLYAYVAPGGAHSIALIRDDGQLLVRFPVLESLPDRSFFTGQATSRAILAGMDGDIFHIASTFDGTERLLVRKNLTRYPVFTTVSARVDEVLAPWRRQVGLLAATTAALELGTVALVLMALRNLRAQRLLAGEREKSQQELQAQRDLFETALDNMAQGLCMFDADERLLVANRSLAAAFGLSQRRSTAGMTVADLIRLAGEGGIGTGALAELDHRLGWLRERRIPGHFTIDIAADRALSVHYRPLATGGWLATFEDVTERRRALARIEFMARHDGLTSLPNRIMLRERLVEALARSNRGECFAVFCLDLDGFKEVNDQFGHAAGDALLQAVARRLQRCVRDLDTVARLGGDEFAIVQVGAAQAAEARALAERLLHDLALPYQLADRQVVIQASIGVSLGPQHGADPDRLLSHADLAMYKAKAEGRNRVCFFAPEMDAQMQRRRLLESDLRRGLEAGEFEPHYQPLVMLASGRVCGFEALVRWNHPEHGLVMPGEFIALAEEIGLIARIGEVVLRRACLDALGWPPATKVAVNLSPVQFRPGSGLVRAVREALDASGLAPGRLELEITETALLQDTAHTLSMLHEIRAMGVRFAMDDFGTGYSSLSYLRQFPFSKIKIDRSFVRDLGTQAESDAIVRAVTDLCRSLGMTITAEGVETHLQFQHLAATGCTEGQGYLFSPALPAGEATALAWNGGQAAGPLGAPDLDGALAAVDAAAP